MTIAKKMPTFQVELLKTFQQKLRLPSFLLKRPKISTMNTSPKIMMRVNTYLRKSISPCKIIRMRCTSPRPINNSQSFLTISRTSKKHIILNTMSINQFKRNSLLRRKCNNLLFNLNKR